MSNSDREALRRARGNAEQAAAAQQFDKQHALDDHAAVTAAIFREGRSLARELEARGFPGVQVVPAWTSGGRFRRGRRIDLAGWMLYDCGDGGDRSESSKVYLISDGRIQVGGGNPFADAERLLSPRDADGILAALRHMQTSL